MRVIKDSNALEYTVPSIYLQDMFSSVQFSSIYICIAHPLMSLMRYRSTSVSIYKKCFKLVFKNIERKV